LGPGEVVLTLSNFFLLGTPQCFYPEYPPTPDKGSSRSLFIPEEAITRHARFPTLTKNIRERRQEKVAINLPIFRDTNTPIPFREPVPPSVIKLLTLRNEAVPASLPEYEPAAKENHIYMDAMCFGMGCSCLQVTIQGCTIEATRRLYDHMTVMTPIMLALSATAPIFKGYLTDVDCRWDVISGSVDDRSKEERGILVLYV
jgi:glutamate--cysteine ligase catalytic subunit